MLNNAHHFDAEIDSGERPLLIVGIDTEEEFDWGKPHDRSSIDVKNIAAQQLMHDRVFDRFGVTPTYLVDYPVVSQPEGCQPLLALMEQGKCQIGAHLHSWVTPPHEEEVNYRNSYAGNLPPGLERQKLTLLTEEIEKRFGCRPTAYRAGRYGVGPGTAAILRDLGYRIDMSVVPKTDMSREDGPNFNLCHDQPYWFGAASELLEIPLSVGFVGALHGAWYPLYDAARTPLGETLRIPGVLARLGLLERIRLSPEGITLDEQIRLTKALYARGHRVFSYNYHSSSLVPGFTPYVSSDQQLEEFVDRISSYFSFFFNELNGVASTPDEILSRAISARGSAIDR